jgi:hypothetical protein
LLVVTNTALMARGKRLIIPYRTLGGGVADVSVRGSGTVRMALDAASAPVVLGDLAAKVLAEFPGTGQPVVMAMLTGLVRCGALITRLHAPGTEPDALGHLVSELETVGASESAGVLRAIRDLLERHSRLLTITASTDAGHDHPLGEAGDWIGAFEQADQTLAWLAAAGTLSRGLRAVLAHHVIFHANRAGIPVRDQAILATLAADTMCGQLPGPGVLPSCQPRPQLRSEP